MLFWKCALLAAFVSLLNFKLARSSATGVCTRTVQSSPSNYTEEYCCSGYSGTPPDCQRTCNYLQHSSYGRVSVTTRNVGDNATYSCNSGFRLVGPSTRTCLSNGNWSGSEPVCNYTVLCPSLDSPKNGSVSVTSNFVGGSATYKCIPGYRTSTPTDLYSSYSYRVCQLSGDWSGTQPTCIKVCSRLPHPYYGGISVTTHDVGGIATYYCYSGFRLSGPFTRTCLSDGSWSGSAPVCNYTVLCPSLDDPDNGHVWVRSNFVGGGATYSCNSGYRLSKYFDIYYTPGHLAPVHITCQLSGEWSGPPATCIRICNSLRSLRYGRVSVTTYDIGGRATYSCNSGFRLSGPSTRTCLSNGNWSGSEPVCNCTVLCPNLDDFSNGSLSVNSNFVGGRAYYSCNPGYQLSGSSRRTCQVSGNWSGTEPTCIRTCNSYLSYFSHGVVSVTSYNVGGNANYSCNSGFRLVGPSTRTCLSDGTWSESTPVCNYTVLCPNLNDLVNGSLSVSMDSNFVGARAYYHCKPGYRLSEYTSRICQLSGNWSAIAVQPTCIRTCNRFLRYPIHGRVSVISHDVGGNATYSCNSGFRLVGPSTRTCLSDGSWSGSAPICNYTVLCPSLEDLDNGSVSMISNFVGGRAIYRCNSGYRLSSSSVRICQLTGNWSGMPPTCIRTCEIHSLVYGRVSVISRYVGSNANYSCNSGFRLVGPSTHTCLSDGTWSGPLPICIDIECPSPDRPINGAVFVRSPYIGGRVEYSCDSGYRLSGSNSTQYCQISGNWSGTSPTCIRQCELLFSINNGRAFMTTHDVGGRATYSCNSGFRLEGSTTRTCLSNGSWSGLAPVCSSDSQSSSILLVGSKMILLLSVIFTLLAGHI